MKKITLKTRSEETDVGEEEKSGAPEDSNCQTEKEQHEKIKQNGCKLIGAAAITDYLKKDFVALFSWKAAYHFPLGKEGGVPVLYLNDLAAWLDEHQTSMKTLSKEYLRRFYDRKREIAEIQSVPEKPLDGIDAIIRATGRPAHIIVNWMTGYDDCPIEKRDGKIYCGSARALRLWMDEKRLVAGNYPYCENIDGRRE